MDNTHGWIASLLLVGSVLLGGCGGGDGSATVKGQVTFDGTPIKDGAINLIPIDSDLRRVGGSISDGAYELTGVQSGPMPGKYRVEIYAFEPIAAPSGAEEGDAEADSATRQVLPPKFNAESDMELDVNASLVEKDFALTP